MAHARTFFRRVFPNVGGSISSLVSGAAIIMLLLYRQPVVAEVINSAVVSTKGAGNTNSATVTPNSQCSDCTGEINCTPPTCHTSCGECGDSFYTFKQTIALCDDNPGRKRRQITSLPAMTTSTTTIPSTTIGFNAWICKKCSVVGCKKCIDLEETPSCETCQDSYLLNNVSRDCVMPIEPEKGLSIEAIAGIVIAVVCVIGIGVVIALYVLRKFRGSSDVNGRAERVKDSPKNKKKYCRSSSHENTILAELGEAPSPPAVVEQNTYTPMSHNKYDHLEKIQRDSELYLQPGAEDMYLNTAAIANELNRTEGHYENTQQKYHNGVRENSTSGNTFKHPAMTNSQESIDTYEPVGPGMPAHESQEIYANDDATMLVLTGAAETGDNDLNEDTDDVYMNA